MIFHRPAFVVGGRAEEASGAHALLGRRRAATLIVADSRFGRRDSRLMSDLHHVVVYTDGACAGNPGPGGFAAVLLCGDARREVVGGYRLTTNNRMELMAAIAALRALKRRCRVTVYSDARYVVDGVTSGSMRRWRALGWRRGAEAVPNADLWAELLSLCERHEVTFAWVRGHAGVGGNERCDALAETAARGGDLPVDDGYESPFAPADPQPTLFDLVEG
jgi:ribonuclease HI